MYAAVREAAAALDGRLIAAAATPARSDGMTDAAVTRSYLESLVAGGSDGLAVGVHTGRGEVLSLPARAELVRIARSITPVVITGVRAADEDLAWAQLAARSGATALLVFADQRNSPATALGYLDALWETTRLPLIAFDLYTAPYSIDQLHAVLQHPAVAAFKPARLRDAVACQDGIAAALHHGRCVLSGEDRMLGCSLVWGARGALVGLASANVSVTAALLRAHRDADAVAFLAACAAVDEFAARVFREPWDGYVQRMLWIAADEGLIPGAFAHDLQRPPQLADAEQQAVLAAARQARERVARLNTPRH